ncbi:MAG: CDP-glycerol glycerophosphotransferase family protein [Clostridia bacterium]|nr:CDP-glycerol glycerophosphotransferase family protein [Clostridia bacterium]
MKESLVRCAAKLPGALSLMCAINAKKVRAKYGDLPVEPNKIIFTNYMGKGYGCNCRPVAQELIERGADFDMVWAVKDPEKQRGAFPKEIRLVQYGSEAMMREYATAGFWVCNYHLVDVFGHGLRKKEGQTYIQMWHGSFGIKRQEKDVAALTKDKVWVKFSKMNSQNTDYWISNCRFENDVYTRSFWDVKNIKPFGHPRNDIFFRAHDEVRRAVKAALGIPQDCRFLLYIPTYRDDMSTEYYNVDFTALKAALEEKTGVPWKIAVRLHPKLAERSEEFVPVSDDVVDATGIEDITDLLASADAALTDYSSAVFDFMLSRNPAFIYATDIEKYNNDRGFYYDIYTTPFPVATNNEELMENIRSFNAAQYQERIDAFLEDKGSYENGTAAKQVADLICAKLNTEN